MNTKRTIVTVLGVSALVGLVGTSSAQFISLDGITEPLAARAKTNDVLLTADFNDASLKDVSAWMRKVNLNFVIDGQALDCDKRVTLHFRGSTGKDVIQSVASAFGISATTKGDVYVLSSESPVVEFAETAPVAAPFSMLTQAQTTPKVEVVPESPSISITIDDDNDSQAKAQAMAEVDAASAQKEIDAAVKAAEQAAKDAEAATDLQSAKSAARRAADAARKAAELARKSRHAFSFGGNGPMVWSFGKGDLKGLEELHKMPDWSKAFKMDKEAMQHLKELKTKDGKAWVFAGDELKSLKDLEKSFPQMKEFKFDSKALEEMKKAGEAMKAFKFDGKEFKELKGMKDFSEGFKSFKFDGKALEELKKLHPEMKDFKGMHLGLGGKMLNLKDFMSSMTESQKKLMKDRGYLKLSDLNEKQKEMLGNPKGSFNLSIQNKDTKLVIKGDDKSATPDSDSI